MPNNKNTQSTVLTSATSVPTPPSIRIFYDRRKGSIEGFLTVIDATGKKLLDKLPARSGQNGYTETNWMPAKSPIPLWQPQVNYYSILSYLFCTLKNCSTAS
jgi:hypothetical protein